MMGADLFPDPGDGIQNVPAYLEMNGNPDGARGLEAGRVFQARDPGRGRIAGGRCRPWHRTWVGMRQHRT